MFYVDIENEKVVSKSIIGKRLELLDGQKEITEELYNSIGKMPCSFTLSNNEIAIIEYIEPDHIIQDIEPSQDDYLLDFDYRLSKIELGLGGV